MVMLFGTPELATGVGERARRVQLFDGPLDVSWHHCATTSDFIADLFALPFAGSIVDYREARHSIGYLVNELAENAVKFRSPGEVIVEAALEPGYLKVKVSNLLEAGPARRFQRFLSELTARDPGELLIQRIEDNAANPGATGSGLGLLTLMNDYGARLAWLFSPREDGRVRLETHAALPMPALRAN